MLSQQGVSLGTVTRDRLTSTDGNSHVRAKRLEKVLGRSCLSCFVQRRYGYRDWRTTQKNQRDVGNELPRLQSRRHRESQMYVLSSVPFFSKSLRPPGKS